MNPSVKTVTWTRIKLAVTLAIFSAQASFAECGVIDTHGKVIIPLNYTRIESVDDQFHADREETVGTNRNKTSTVYSKIFDRNGQESSASTVPPPVGKIFKGIPPRYSVESDLGADGCIVRADAANGGMLGHIDVKGQVRLPFEFQSLRYVKESRIFAGKRSQGERAMHYSVYDMQGHLIANLPEYVKDYANGCYQEGLFLVGDDIGIAFVDLNGKVVIPPNNYRYPSPIYEGLAEIQFKHNGEIFCGYVDKHNKLVTELFKGLRADPFYRGLGVLTKTWPDGTVKLGAVNKDGRVIFPIEFEPFDSLGTRLVGGRRNGKFQLFLRDSGKLYATLPEGCVAAWVYDFDKNDIVPFNVGGVPLSPGMNGNTAVGGKWGYCNEHGKIVIEPAFKFAGLFSGDVATACIDDKYGETKMGVIDRKGHWQVPPVYDSLRLEGNDRAIVYSGATTSGIAKTFHDPEQRNVGSFQNVLKYYDLIGMNENQLDSVRGKGNAQVDQQELPSAVRKRICYDFVPMFMGGKPVLSVEFGIDKNGKVWGWRFSEPNGSWDWISENRIIANFDKDLTFKNIILKPVQ
jgi:WG containing repeat